jgi:hypothetical protein
MAMPPIAGSSVRAVLRRVRGRGPARGRGVVYGTFEVTFPLVFPEFANRLLYFDNCINAQRI